MELSACSLPFNFPHLGITRTSPPLPEAVAAESWTIDHNRVQVGRGQAAYRRARSLLEQWRHFDLGWASVNAPPVKPGSPVVVTAFSLCCWSCNPLRISFVEEGGLRRNAQQLPPWVGAPPTAAEGASLRQQRLHGGGSGVLGLLGTGGGKRTQHQQQAAAAEAAAALPPRGRRFAFAHTTLQGHQIRGEERFCVAWNAQDDSVWYEIYTLSRPGSWITAAAHPLLRAFQRKFAADSCDAMQRQMAARA